MKIARVIEYFSPHIGGMERHGLILSREQIKLGHDVQVFIGVGDQSLFNKTLKAPLQFLPLYSKIRRIWFNFWAYQKIKKIHKKNPFDIIHLHGDFVESYFGGKLSKKLNIPAVITIHAGLNKRLLKPKNAKYFEDISKIICVSNEIAEDLESIGVQKEKIKIVTSGVDLNEFNNANKNAVEKLRNQYSKPIIISIGVLRINKGFSCLIEAFKMVKEKINSATLIIIGSGPRENDLKKQSSEISNIYFLGIQEHGKVIEYLKSADIFVLASISTENDREGTPTSIMEAMAAGLPIVATKIGGNSQLIEDGKNGFLVNPGDPLELTQAIVKSLDDGELAKRMGMRNLDDIKSKDWPIIAQQIEKVYAELLRNLFS